MKKLLLTLAAVVFAFANVSEAAKGNIPIAPFQIVQSIQSIAQAIQFATEPIHNSKPVTTPASKRKQTASRSSRRPSLAAASNQSSGVVSTPTEASQAAGSPSAQFAGVPSSTVVSEPAAVAALPTSAAPSKSSVGNVNESPTQAASIAAAATPATSSNAAETATAAAAGFVVLAFIAFSIVMYFLPIFVAGLRGKAEGQFGIFLITVLGGWTGVLWLVCLIWSFTGRTKADIRREEQQHNQLLAALAQKA